MLFLWFFHACRRGSPRFLMVADHINYLTFEDPGAVNTVRRALKLAEAGDLYGAAETAGVDVGHAAAVSEGMRRGMRFSIGAELDNDPRSRPDAQNIVDAMRPDGMIRSVHFLTIEHPEKGADWQWPFDNPEFKELFDTVGTDRTWDLYVAKLIDDIEKLPGNIVGHFYVPASFGHWPEQKKLEKYEDRLLEACAARGMAVEINTRFLYRDNADDHKTKYRAANLRLMKKAKAKGVGIAIGSDAHSPKDQGGSFEAVLKMLDEAGVNEIVFPVGGRLARVALRATKEHIEKAKTQDIPLAGSSIIGQGRAELGLPERNEAEEKALAKAGTDAAKRRASAAARTAAGKKPAKVAALKAALKKGLAPSAKAAKTAPLKKTAVAKAAPVKKAAPAKLAPVKKLVPAKSVPVKKAAPQKKAVPPKKVSPAKKAAPTKKAAPVKSAAGKKAAPPKKAAPQKKAAVTKKITPPPKKAATAKKSAAVKKAAPIKKSAPAAKKAAPAKKPVKKPAPAPAKKKAPAKKVAPAKKTPKRR